ncbi:bifunctional glycosyltransferase family 2/GtrA family protein [Desulfovibrio ferrophilus]|nr:bifunctional glycosyltransferase family 2/GtrA family protein [Desulfovibrio ferrophilus]
MILKNARRVCAVVPALNPNRTLLTVVSGLLESGAATVVVINDGSEVSLCPLFSEIGQLSPKVTVLAHAVNMGKGQALKTAFNHILVNALDCDVVVTVDADGQHLPEDAMRLASSVDPDHKSLHIGCREFGGDVPLRSRFGNIMTRQVVRLLMGLKTSDTQSGLRAFPLEMLKPFLRIRSAGYDYELDMLLGCHEEGVPLHEQPITTIYEPGNPSSHFNPVLDSFRIYFVFLRYIGVSLASFLLDYLVFSMAILAFSKTAWVTHLVVRLFTSGVNFYWNRKHVFKSRGRVGHESIRYFMSMLYVLFASTCLLYFFSEVMALNSFAAKPLAELITFLISFALLRNWVFRKKTTAGPDEGVAGAGETT